MIRDRGLARSKSPTSGAASSTCSKLSRMSRTLRSRTKSSNRSAGVRWPASWSPIAPTMADATSAGSVTGSRATKNAPSGYSSATSAATWRLSRVLPVPPGPVSVSRRERPRRSRASATSRSRPTKVVSCVGRLLGVRSRVRRAGKSAGRVSITSWYRCSGRWRSLSRCSPMSRNVTPGGRALDATATVEPDTSTWPPWPADAIRATRCRSIPT